METENIAKTVAEISDNITESVGVKDDDACKSKTEINDDTFESAVVEGVKNSDIVAEITDNVVESVAVKMIMFPVNVAEQDNTTPKSSEKGDDNISKLLQ
ncbi:hypothetical protein EVAR_101559_1 [Eumeta japonica]|uniref:Uncharacterized protein n=1 Tax=Eumeta variegata TaxID=151549 RepID=A0A4C1TJ80_EUMVA|nr:hypothetical protein EVAR_101559_1 [Eumeta japonica]